MSEDSKRKIVGGGRTKFKAQVSESSKRYLLRQAKDPYSAKALKEGYRSRAVYKLKEINEKYDFVKPNINVVDLGAAPGGWSQFLAQTLNKNNTIIAIDKIPIEPIEGVTFLKGDFTKDEVYEELLALCPSGVQLVLSDMAPETSGHGKADHLRIMALAEMALEFAEQVLAPGGDFLVKIFQGGEEVAFREKLRKKFAKVSFQKPPSSRKVSSEIFVLAQGYKG